MVEYLHMHMPSCVSFISVRMWQSYYSLCALCKKKLNFRHTFFCSCCRSGRPDAHQALDAITEELNKLMKAWAGGDRNSDMWRRIARMFQ